MFKKIRELLHRKRPLVTDKRMYSYKEMFAIVEKWGNVRYNDGRRDGLAIAREQATKSLKEILWHQNKNQ